MKTRSPSSSNTIGSYVVRSALLSALLPAALLAGCNGSREVQIDGDTSAGQGASVTSAIHLDVYDVPKDGEEKLAFSTKIDKLGAFSQKVDLENDKVRVVAIADTNGDGKCTAGEAWGETTGTIKDDKLPRLTLVLQAAPCPTVPAATK